MTNLLLLIIAAVLLFGAASVRSFFGGFIWTVVAMALVIGIIWFVVWFGNKYKKDKDTREATLFMVWLGSLWFLFNSHLDWLGYTLLVAGPAYYVATNFSQTSLAVKDWVMSHKFLVALSAVTVIAFLVLLLLMFFGIVK